MVAVLLMNIENTAVISINPNMMRCGESPNGRSKTPGHVLVEPELGGSVGQEEAAEKQHQDRMGQGGEERRVRAGASNPAGIGTRALSLMSRISRRMIRAAVACRGMASVTHRTMASRNTEKMRCPATDSPSNWTT